MRSLLQSPLYFFTQKKQGKIYLKSWKKRIHHYKQAKKTKNKLHDR